MTTINPLVPGSPLYPTNTDILMANLDSLNTWKLEVPSSPQARQKIVYNGTSWIKKNDSLPFVTVWTDRSADYVCDGTADNVQIQEAIDSLPSGGVVFIKPWTYNISANFKLWNWIHLIWSWVSTILVGSSGIWGIIYYSSLLENVKIQDICFDCNNVANISAIQLFHFSWVTVSWIFVKNVNGIWGLRFWDMWVDEVVTKSYGLKIENVTIDNAQCNTYETLITINTRGIYASGLHISNSPLVTASMVSIFLNSSEVIFEGNYIESDSDDYGLLDITGTQNVSIIWNTLLHTGTNGGNGIVARNNRNLVISGNNITWPSSVVAWGSWIQVIDWSGTIDGHTNPNPYSDSITINGNSIYWCYTSVNFDNPTDTNCGWKNVNISGNTFTGFNYSAVWAEYVSWYDSDGFLFQWNTVTPRSAGDKILVNFTSSWTHKPKKLVFDGNIFKSTTSNNTTVFSLQYADIVKFWNNHSESLWTWAIYSLSNCTNVSYSIYSSFVALYSSSNLTSWASAGWVTFDFDTEIYDSHTFHSTVSNTSRITIPENWAYKIGFRGSYAVRDAWSHIQLRIVKNWGTILWKIVQDNANASNNKYIPFDTVAIDNAVAWDYYEVQLYSSTWTSNVLIWWGQAEHMYFAERLI